MNVVSWNDRDVFSFLLLFRLTSVAIVKTWYVPDEYWQSLEVAHRFAFGYGELTWEWKQGVRSYAYPLIIGFFYKILQFIRLDTVFLLVTLPRALQAILTAYSDYRFYVWSGRKKWALFIVASSYFWWFVGSRTLINTFEASLTTIALSYFPWPNKSREISHPTIYTNKFIWIVGFLTFVRPTAAIVWLPLVLYHVLTSKESLIRLVIARYLPIGTVLFVTMTLIDSWVHGSLIFTGYEFLKANVVNNVGEFYGAHPWHWYLSVGFPAFLGMNFIPFVFAAYSALKNKTQNELVLLFTIFFTIFVYSLLPHKEFRFILPILPIAMHLQAVYLSKWSSNSKIQLAALWIAASILAIANLIPAGYLSLYHQRGPIDVMTPLQEVSAVYPHNSSFLFLTPCHSTPLYSHLHSNVTTRYLTCLPNLNNIANYNDEADMFYRNPSGWLRSNYPTNKSPPSHVVAFDVLQPKILDALGRYKPTHKIYNCDRVTDSRVGKNIIVYERVREDFEEKANAV